MRRKTSVGLMAGIALATGARAEAPKGLELTPKGTLEMQGLSVIIEQNHFSPIFFDEKNAGIQVILHGNRIAADGEVRLNPTPGQWDPVPAFVSEKRGQLPDQLIVTSAYPKVDLNYRVEVTAEGSGFRIAVHLDKPLPAELAGKAGFNLDFLPTAYFGKTYLMGSAPGLFPRNPSGPMARDGSGDPLPFASGAQSVTLSPEDPLTRVTITSESGPLALYDARNRAQNGWFVVRSPIAAGAKDNAVVWHVKPNVIPGWLREPVISFNQAGYTPARSKVALIELDPQFRGAGEAELVKLAPDGTNQSVFRGALTERRRWKRYDYAAFDFSPIREPGIYAISYAGHLTNPFRISADAYDNLWQPSLDTYLAAQMDHMAIREQYRVWSGLSHMDDARQAPANYVHFDGYKMGPSLDSPFKAGEHIPGLATGGWQDAGDYDIQTPSNAWVIRDLAWARELFGLPWDETSINEEARAVEIRKPDGVEDSLQQIRHGTMQLLAQYKVFGHAITGIIDPTLRQYTHLGDSGSQTDRMIYDPNMGPLESNGTHSGITDDRWAFTTDEPGTNLFVAAALAAASRHLGEIDPAMAAEALETAQALWEKQQSRKPKDGARPDDSAFMPGGIDTANVTATAELVIATKGNPKYTRKLQQLQPAIEAHFDWIGGSAVRAIPYMDSRYRTRLAALVKRSKAKLDAELAKNPFGVPITEGGWAGSNLVATFGSNMYLMHQAFPEIVGPEYTLNALDYMLGRHPENNLSLVSAVGTASKLNGYGHNRADYGFIAGGMAPGVLIIKPDFPELKTDWPFLWFESEYTVSTTSAYILAAKAAMAVTQEVR